MKAQHLLLATAMALPMSSAFVSTARRTSFVRPLRDMEGDSIDQISLYQIEQKLNIQSPLSNISVEDAEKAQGMPWKSSIDPKISAEQMMYIPFWEWQMEFMKDNLTNLRVIPSTNEKGDTDFSFNENQKKKARIVNMQLQSDEYRKIRMTYYDAGEGTQVFNSVWYPNPAYNLPVLGIDLLAFNQKKYLAIVDFQPLHDEEGDHAQTFEHKLKPIKDQYESLKGRMSSKFYDETQFFSKQMLFARFDDGNIVEDDLMPAFQSYVQTHLDLVKSTTPDATTEGMKAVLDRQQAYDTYSAERDPATGLFTAMFGAEWAGDFVYDFLFSLSERAPGQMPTIPVMGPPPGAGGRPKQGQGAPAAAAAPQRA